MVRKFTVDRDYELDELKRSLQCRPEEAASILLIRAGVGQGKSSLIERFIKYCQDEAYILHAHVDLKGGSLEPPDILRSIRDDLHPMKLQRCSHSLTTPPLMSISVGISGVTNLGSNTNTVSAPISFGPGIRELHKRWWAEVARDFIEDILEYSKVSPSTRFVLLFDTFDQASPDTRAWIEAHILRMATPKRASNLLVVIAGREVPEPSGEWERYSQLLPLQPLRIEDWEEYALRIRSTITPQQISQVFKKHAAIPLKMAEVIDALA
jgi:hypothetical protein